MTLALRVPRISGAPSRVSGSSRVETMSMTRSTGRLRLRTEERRAPGYGRSYRRVRLRPTGRSKLSGFPPKANPQFPVTVPRRHHAARGRARAARAEFEIPECEMVRIRTHCSPRVFRRGTVDPAAAYVWLGHQQAPRRQIEPPPDGPATRREQACSKRAKRFTGGRDSPPPPPPHL